MLMIVFLMTFFLQASGIGKAGLKQRFCPSSYYYCHYYRYYHYYIQFV